MVTIQLKINKCSECPNCKRTKLYTDDSWGHAEDFWCKAVEAPPERMQGREKVPFKLIKGYVEWDREIPAPPAWCPVADPKYKLTQEREEAVEELGRLYKNFETIKGMGGIPNEALRAIESGLQNKIKDLTSKLNECSSCGYDPCMCDQQ